MRTGPGNVEAVVNERYGTAARQREESLCCPVLYDPTLLRAIPREVIERDYGCGDPTRHVRPGETVLDLGSGSGKACFLASQVVGRTGRVIGVDANAEMLSLARRSAPEVAERIGHANVEFRRGRIQDLRLDLDAADEHLAAHPVASAEGLLAVGRELDRLRSTRPLVEPDSVDVVISNCVLNLVHPADKRELFAEIFRVLRRGGRAVISDIVSDEDVPVALQSDAELWSGCVSGAMREDLFVSAFEEAGFYGIRILERGEHPWRTVEGIEFRSITLEAWKGKEGPCLDRHHAVVYRGPFLEVLDDDGHRLRRGVRTAVCEKTFQIIAREPYQGHFDLVPPRVLPPLGEALPFPCAAEPLVRSPRQTKGDGVPMDDDPTCQPREGCC